jgi:hypothetical protein
MFQTIVVETQAKEQTSALCDVMSHFPAGAGSFSSATFNGLHWRKASVVVDSVWFGIQRGIESNTPRSLPDPFRTSSRAASSLRGRHPARRPTIRKATCGTYREPEPSGVLCRNGDAVSGRDKGQTENIVCRCELQCDRKGGLFAAASGDGSRLHHD